VRVRLLGPVDVAVDGRSRPVNGLRRKAVLAALALHDGQAVSTDRLVDVVWGESAPPTVVNSLQTHIWYLRGVLGSREAIVARPPGYLLNLGVDGTDAQAAERLLRQGRQAADPAQGAQDLRAALALWRGPPLADVSGSAWLQEQSQRLELLADEVRRALVQARLAAGEHAELVLSLERMAAEEPLDEQVHGQLMLALYRCGRQADALAVFGRLRAALAEQLGIDPSSMLRDLHTAILRQDEALAVPAPAQLPPAVPAFAGRGGKLARPGPVLAQAVGTAQQVPPAGTLYRWPRPRARPAPTAADISRAKDVLAGMVAEQWEREAEARSLDNPDPMPVQWDLVAPGGPDQVTARACTVSGGVPQLSGRSDHVSELVSGFRSLRRRRLVILGGPGSGKTTLAVQLVRELLSTRAGDEPVPVLVSVAGWDTRVHPRLQDWLAVRLGQDYPALRAPGLGPAMPRCLAERGQVLPVLDGFDELPRASRAAALTALNRSLRKDDQVIVTSRTSEYSSAVGEAQDVLTCGAVIVARPLAPAAAAGYLSACVPPGRAATWAGVLAALRGGAAAAPLAQVCSTPLGLWLLRATYLVPDGDPGPLLDTERYPTPQALQGHLLDQLIPALIAARQPGGGAGLFWPRRRQDPGKARDWLGYLAFRLTNPASPSIAPGRDLAWWQLHRYTLTPRAAATTASLAMLWLYVGSGCAAGIPTALIATLIAGPAAGLAAGLAAFLTVALASAICGTWVSSWLDSVPGCADLRLSGRASRLARTLAGSLVFGLVLGGAGEVTDGLIFGPAAGLVAGAGGVLAGLITGLVAWAETPILDGRARTPTAAWQADRNLQILKFLTLGTWFASLFGLMARHVPGSGISFGLVTGLIGGIGLVIAGRLPGIAVGTVHHSWLICRLATLGLACSRRLPPNPIQFLDDAHRLGLLRAVGPFYQFRHADLHDHLAASYAARHPPRQQTLPDQASPGTGRRPSPDYSHRTPEPLLRRG
jgi:DNA-binding SARP family transcriptional activator